ncbi:protein-glutamine gamma-glutamyltransferase [Bacillus sp. KH172YL63]|uniref:protein-glutamine gamma-glutamyltransferase n=1 Tax=Bacillus sp. KH172YL63 TaxID=2709784 RepID=UPI0013E4FC0D|nr:protein-glutamine gamma-glutamyltransferase [Bacillus sp. KH172YL63]BCB04939.1 protein-glutamine gamma-glutamyltransferase [Bacillus sp. KH172YL63]
MIVISNELPLKTLPDLTPVEEIIFQTLKGSPTDYRYQHLGELKYELKIRERIISNAKALNESDAKFSAFEHSTFNTAYWDKTPYGYRLKESKRPSDGIEDIFTNSSAYSFECVTSIVLIYYKSILDTIRTSSFNELFSPLLVWGHHYDDDMGMVTYEGLDYIPGDVYYFYNPDFEDPIWMGENSVFLKENEYFGHGVGVVSHDEMIDALNTLRKKDAKESAYLLNQVTRLKFSELYRFT